MLGLYDSGSFEVNEAYREVRTNISLNTDIKTIVFTKCRNGRRKNNYSMFHGKMFF